MDDHYQTIARHFQRAVEAMTGAVDPLSADLQRAGALLTRAMLGDARILACGNGPDAALAGLFVSSMLGRCEQDRPALPALSLAADGPALTASAEFAAADQFARQLAALGQSGDVLLCINSGVPAPNLQRVLQVACSRGLGIVLLTHRGDTELSQWPGAQDVLLQVEAERRAQVLELHTVMINCLCELVERELFGDFGPG
jgi:D-sedoheptulose 7-phosphate isomerase